MKLTKKLEADVNVVYDTYWKGLLAADIATYTHVLDESFRLIGTTESEVFFKSIEAIDFLKATADQVAGNIELRNRLIVMESLDSLVLITEQSDTYVKIDGEWTYYGKVRCSSILEKKAEEWKFIHMHLSFPDSKANDGETIGLEKISKENLELRDAIKRRTVELENKNRELEIETSLERVRAVAMGMKKPEDLPNVCEVLFKELQTLGFAEMRNAMVNIHNDEKRTFVNYDYSDEIGKSITPLFYDIHPVIKKQIKQIRSADDAFSETVFKGKDLESWKAFRKNRGEKEDKRIKNSTALYYYFYSIGTGSIGVSTFSAIPEEKQEVLKRFRNVFAFAYRRYMDVAQAEAQAREAQIEVAVERVRAKALAMHKSEDLHSVVVTLKKELMSLRIPDITAATIYLAQIDGSIRILDLLDTAEEDDDKPQLKLDKVFRLEDTDPKLWIRRMWNRNENYFVLEANEDDFVRVIQWIKTVDPAGAEMAEEIIREKSIKKAWLPTVKLEKGVMNIDLLAPPSSEIENIMLKMGAGFDLAYKRFLDLQKAEAQTREAQIELGLERVRARAMAMQNSNELAEAAQLLYHEFGNLGINTFSCGYMFIDEIKQIQTAWVVLPDGSLLPNFISFPLTGDHVLNSRYKDWKEKKPLHIFEIQGEVNKEHHRFLSNYVPPFVVEDIFSKIPDKIIFNCANFYAGYLLILATEHFSPEEQQIIIRFAKVFDQTYTRFIDLQKAEAQAREAKIEAALERVRSRSMAMHSSHELKEVITVVTRQFINLGFDLDLANFNYLNTQKEWVLWLATPGYTYPELLRIPVIDHPLFNRPIETLKKGQSFLSDTLTYDEFKIAWQHFYSTSPLNDYDSAERKEYITCSKGFARSIVFMKHISLTISNFKGIPYTEDQNSILQRFAKVFEQTYTRFLDLQKAEEQAREAQIEVALERVRSRTMAMHHSSELADTATILFQQIKELGFEIWSCGFGIWRPEVDLEEAWMSTGDSFPIIMVPFKEDPTHLSIYEASQRGESVFEVEVKGDVLTRHYDWLMSQPSFKIVFGQIENSGIILPTVQYKYAAFFKQGYLHLITTKPQPDIHNINQRFAKVFEQTYTRFLDLQKAEVQTREAQIEIAIERVRAKALAMHQSDEIMGVTVVMRMELESLNIPGFSATTFTLKQDDGTIRLSDNTDAKQHEDGLWESTEIVFRLEKNNPDFYINRIWNSNEKYLMVEQDENDLLITVDWIREFDRALANTIENYFKENGIKHAWHPAVKLEYGWLNLDFYFHAPEPEVETILLKMAAAFDLAYKRFLDLQKAEAQAREAKIEAALERVRSRSMGMQKSEELRDVIQVIYDQFVQLGIEAPYVGFYTDIQESNNWNLWIADVADTYSAKVLIPYLDHPIFHRYVEAKEKGLDSYAYSVTYQYEEKNKILTHWLANIDPIPLQEEIKEWIYSQPGWNVSNVIMKDVGLYLFNFELTPFSDADNAILLRFAKVFEQTYTRFRDLEKAEAQAREAQIEAALERVRSRSLAMHRSEELEEVILVVSEQLRQLQFRFHNVSFGFDTDQRGLNFWLASPDLPKPLLIKVPYIDNPAFNRPLDARNKGFDFSTDILTQVENHQFLRHMFENSELRNIPAESKNFLISTLGFARSQCLMKNTILTIGNYVPIPYNEEQNAVIRRFGKVFEQAYTRFLDLQKAEAQARESQIQLALERVRARTMAMHNSSELIETAELLYDQLRQLGAESLGVAFAICEPDNIMVKKWTSIGVFSVPYTSETGEQRMYEAWKNQIEIYEEVYEGEKIKKYYELFMEIPAFREGFQKTIESGQALPIWQKSHAVTFKHGYLLFITTKPFKEVYIFTRFAKVFEQTYIRFLDLQKAEAQAQEAKIEAALERVRSKTMAMYKSEQLPETAQVLFEQFAELGKIPDRISIGIIKEELQMIEWWVTDQMGSQLASHFDTSILQPTIAEFFTAWKEGKESTIVDLSGESLKEWIVYVRDEVKMPIDDSKIKGRRMHHAAFFSQGLLLISTHEPVPDETMQLLVRFAKVFSQTYTRFLDLQKAEAQAREAQIEASLEKVRANAMAMQRSSDLLDIVVTMRHEFTKLGHEAHYFWYMNWLPDKYEKAMTSGDGTRIGMVLELPRGFHGNAGMNEWELNDEPIGIFTFEPEAAIDYLNRMANFGQFRQVDPNAPGADAVRVIGGLTFVMARTRQGEIGYSLPGVVPMPPKEDMKTLVRFAGVFDLAYQRYSDIAKAELSAKTALQQSSLDRVRAEIASMRTRQDLERITPLIWKELTTLGIPFVRCGVFIMDEQEELIHTYLSTPDGKAIAAFHLPYNSNPFFNTIEDWRAKKIHVTHWDKEEFSTLADTLVKEGQIRNREQYLKAVPKGGLHLHYVPFLQGIVYVGNTTALTNDHLHLIQSVADAFSTAYARYEDFNKIESAKAQVEKTLSDLKLTQAQLVQSEKMASLGELTAGIAHEIQNPLNFVNNFSEVSTELIDEMNEEIDKGNFDDAKEIANDLKQNLIKINHHGKRAGDIVKGMLLHSRTSSGKKEITDINTLTDEYLRLAYHGLKAKDKSFNTTMETYFDPKLPKIEVIQQDIGRVILNLITNAFYAVNERNKQLERADSPSGVGGKGGNEQEPKYEPKVSITTQLTANSQLQIAIKDNGSGIPAHIKDKIFQPFFTTKPTGQGTGLGLSLAYDIVKAHGGELKVETKEGEGSEFIISIPAN